LQSSSYLVFCSFINQYVKTGEQLSQLFHMNLQTTETWYHLRFSRLGRSNPRAQWIPALICWQTKQSSGYSPTKERVDNWSVFICFRLGFICYI